MSYQRNQLILVRDKRDSTLLDKYIYIIFKSHFLSNETIFKKMQCNKTYLRSLYKYNSTCRNLIRKCIPYGEVVNNAKKLKSDTSELVQFVEIFIRKGYDLQPIIDSEVVLLCKTDRQSTDTTNRSN